MSSDRLAAMRAQGSSSNSNSSPRYELTQLGSAEGSYEKSSMMDDDFFNEISGIQDDLHHMDENIVLMSRLRTQELDSISINNGTKDQLETVIQETKLLSANLKKRITFLQTTPITVHAAGIRRPQIERVHRLFLKELQRYQAEEKLSRDKQRERIARQYKIVNPDATAEEIDEIVSSGTEVQVFAQATMGSRYTQSQNVYNEVQKRHEDIKKIERTISEVAQMMNDLSAIVEQQGDVVNVIEKGTEGVRNNVEAAQAHTERARLSAIAYRNKRWICFILSIIIIIIIAVVIGCKVSNKC